MKRHLSLLLAVMFMYSSTNFNTSAFAQSSIPAMNNKVAQQDLKLLLDRQAGYCGYLFAQCIKGFQFGRKMKGLPKSSDRNGNPAYAWCVVLPEVSNCMRLLR